MTMQTTPDQGLQEKEEQAVEAAQTAGRGRTYVPRSDVYETEESIVVVADMPGVDDKSVSITLEKNVLTLAGKVEADAPEGYRLALSEYDTGNYERRFALSQSVDREGIEASVKEGILTLTLPKAREAMPRKIEVKAG